jgi:nitroreductase/NAD-dependent dihydropyrimidine dehydrogenase PreA subunit
MIVIDRERCNACGSCVRICHEHCMELIDGSVRIDHTVCSTCTQCIAICPQAAPSWDGVPPSAFEPERLPAAEQLEELFRERRSVRDFTQEPIGREQLGRIVRCGGFAPTNNYAMRAVVVDDPAVIREVDKVVVRFTLAVYRAFFRSRPVFELLRRITPAMKATDKVKMESVLSRGQNFRSFPAAMVFVAGDRRTALSLESAQYALANMSYCAQSLGLGSCLFGPGRIVLDRSRPVRRRLGLGKHEHILGTLLLGHPAVRFRNRVEGKALGIHWV